VEAWGVAQEHGDQILMAVRFTIRFRLQLLQKDSSQFARWQH